MPVRIASYFSSHFPNSPFRRCSMHCHKKLTIFLMMMAIVYIEAQLFCKKGNKCLSFIDCSWLKKKQKCLINPVMHSDTVVSPVLHIFVIGIKRKNSNFFNSKIISPASCFILNITKFASLFLQILYFLHEV
jgi:hypothetical protein